MGWHLRDHFSHFTPQPCSQVASRDTQALFLLQCLKSVKRQNRSHSIASLKGLVEQHPASMGRMAASSENKEFAKHFALAVVRPTERVNDMVARSGYGVCPCNEERAQHIRTQ